MCKCKATCTGNLVGYLVGDFVGYLVGYFNGMGVGFSPFPPAGDLVGLEVTKT